MELIGLPDAARVAGVSITTVRNYIRDQCLTAYEKGSRMVVERGELMSVFGLKRLTPREGEGCRIIAVANQKGGVGKTTTAVALASVLARDVCVLAVDCDPQGNMTQAFGFDPDAQAATLYNVLVEDIPLDSVLLPVGPPPPASRSSRPTWTWPTPGARSPARSGWKPCSRRSCGRCCPASGSS